MRKINNFHKSKPIVQNVKTNSVNEGKAPQPLTNPNDISDWNPGMSQEQLNEAKDKINEAEKAKDSKDSKSAKSGKSGKSGRASQNALIANMTSYSQLGLRRLQIGGLRSKHSFYVKKAEALQKEITDHDGKDEKALDSLIQQYEAARKNGNSANSEMEEKFGEEGFGDIPKVKPPKLEEPKEPIKELPKEDPIKDPIDIIEDPKEKPKEEPKEDPKDIIENPFDKVKDVEGVKKEFDPESEKAVDLDNNVAKRIEPVERAKAEDLHKLAKAKNAGAEVGLKVITYYLFDTCGGGSKHYTTIPLGGLEYPEVFDLTNGVKYVMAGEQQQFIPEGRTLLADSLYWGNGTGLYAGTPGLTCP